MLNNNGFSGNKDRVVSSEFYMETMKAQYPDAPDYQVIKRADVLNVHDGVQIDKNLNIIVVAPAKRGRPKMKRWLSYLEKCIKTFSKKRKRN